MADISIGEASRSQQFEDDSLTDLKRMRSRKINKNTKVDASRLSRQFEQFYRLKSTVRPVEIPTSICHYEQCKGRKQ
jgi:hypothetical protein